MTDLRDEARGRPCMVRLPGICVNRTDTTVLAHVRMAGLTGIGQKADDRQAAWCCFECHEALDGRAQHRGWTRDELRLAHLEGVIRTQQILIKEGKL